MTRRKRTPEPEPPRKRVAFQIPESLAQLSALSRSLVQRSDGILKVVQDKDTSDVVARAQALSNSPQPESQSAKAVRWKYDQKVFPDAQTWVQPISNPGSRSLAKSVEHQWRERQAMDFAGQANVITTQDGTPTHPLMAAPPGNQNSTKRCAVHEDSDNRRVTSTQETTNSAYAHGSPYPNKKMRMTDSVSRRESDVSSSRPLPMPAFKGAPTTSQSNLDVRRQAIIEHLMKTGPVSISSAGANIQIPANPPPPPTRSPPPSLPPPNFTAGIKIQPTEVLELSKHSSQIEALIAKKRVENAATGHLRRLRKLQAEHRQKDVGPHSCSRPVPAFRSSTHPTLSHLPDWPASPSPTTSQRSVETAQPQEASGYAEEPTAEQDTELDLRSLFSSCAPPPHHQPSKEDEETARALRKAIYTPTDTAQPPASPSAQLLSSLASVSSNALAQPQNPHPHSTHPSEQQHPQPQPPPPLPLPTKQHPQRPHRKYRKQKLRFLSHTDIPTSQPPNTSIGNQKPLTPQQQEMKLLQQQTERSQHEARMSQLRMIAEQRAKMVVLENKRKSEERREQSAPKSRSGKVEEATAGEAPLPSDMAGGTGTSTDTGKDNATYPSLPSQSSVWETVTSVPQNVGYYFHENPSSTAVLSSSRAAAVDGSNLLLGAGAVHTVYHTLGFASGGVRSASASASANGSGRGGGRNMEMNMQARFRNAGVQGFEVPKR